MDGGAWWAAVHGVAKSRTRLSNFTFAFHFPALEREMATHSSVLAWRIPGTGEPGGLPSMGSHRVGHDWSDLAAVKKKTHTHTNDSRRFPEFFNIFYRPLWDMTRYIDWNIFSTYCFRENTWLNFYQLFRKFGRFCCLVAKSCPTLL